MPRRALSTVDIPESALVIGSGGREHAVFEKLLRDGINVLAIPGNGGMANNVSINITDFELLASIARNSGAYTFVGPEIPLADGIVDYFKKIGLGKKIFGPTKNAAEIEASKAFAKALMRKYDIPTARSFVAASRTDVIYAVRKLQRQFVVKQDGLAGGKGVIIPEKSTEGIRIAAELVRSGKKIIIEEFLHGRELSYFVFTDGKDFVPLLPACDYKYSNDGNIGQMTGGMGSYAPVSWLPAEMEGKIQEKVIVRAIEGMAKEGRPFKGLLYAGLMIVDSQPYVLEFNCRFGDPETQSILALMESPLLPYMMASSRGGMKNMPRIKWKKGASVTVVMASGGYPGAHKTKIPIYGLDAAGSDNINIYHAGTFRSDGVVYTSGGRVLNVVATGESLAEAKARAYDAVGKISWNGEFHRNDIGEQQEAPTEAAPWTTHIKPQIILRRREHFQP